MTKKKLIIGSIALFAIIAVILVSAIGCQEDRSMGEAEELSPIEIREYQGENLSSIKDFRENSIKGPQYIEKEGYQLKITGLVDSP